MADYEPAPKKVRKKWLVALIAAALAAVPVIVPEAGDLLEAIGPALLAL